MKAESYRAFAVLYFKGTRTFACHTDGTVRHWWEKPEAEAWAREHFTTAAQVVPVMVEVSVIEPA